MRPGYLVGGLIGSIVIGVTFWLALYGAVQLNRSVPIVSGPSVAVAPVPAVVLPAKPATAAAPAPAANGPRVIKIVATDLKFDQKEIKVPAGQPVEVTLDNKGVLEHDFTLQQPAFRVAARVARLPAAPLHRVRRAATTSSARFPVTKRPAWPAS
jgi:hypothetical protein